MIEQMTTAHPRPDDWWRTATVYQIWPRSFADGDGDGIGDLTGIIDRLGHLRRLGVDAVWLSPIYRSPHDDAGYDISDYRRIDPVFGTMEQFDELLAAVHDHGLRLVMDLVVNHTSDEHEWFQASRSSVDAPTRDWYWWQPARPGTVPGQPGAEPNNWGSLFGGSAWEFDEATGEYYLHLFTRKQPDLNWEHPDVRSAVYSMMNWWLDKGVDGFRMDVINFISKDVSLPDGRVRGDRRYGNGMPHFVDGPRIHEFLQEMHREVFAGRDDLLVVGEMPGVRIEEAQRYTDPARGEVDMVFQFEHVSLDHGRGGRWDLQPLRLTDLKASLGRWQDGLADVGWNSLYWSNHDQPRIVSRWGDDGEWHDRSAKALATLLHLHHGTPYVYQGEEIGMTNTTFTSLDQLRDVEAINHARSALADGVDEATLFASLSAGARDNARTPMQWDDGPNAGFTTGTPWMDVQANHTRINAAAQVDDPTSVFHHYRRLIELRHEVPVVAFGRFEMLLAEHEQVYAFTRTLDDDRLLVLVNVGAERADVQLADEIDAAAWTEAAVLLSNLPTDGSAGPGASVGPDGAVSLAPWEAIVLQRPAAIRSHR